MATIQASEFKAKCLALMDQVARTGESITITKNGRPIAELHPHAPPRVASPIGLNKGTSVILGDVVAPLDPGVWKVLE
jgi:prevent-host-death family protein